MSVFLLPSFRKEVLILSLFDFSAVTAHLNVYSFKRNVTTSFSLRCFDLTTDLCFTCTECEFGYWKKKNNLVCKKKKIIILTESKWCPMKDTHLHLPKKKWRLGNNLQLVSVNKHRENQCYGFNTWNVLSMGKTSRQSLEWEGYSKSQMLFWSNISF